MQSSATMKPVGRPLIAVLVSVLAAAAPGCGRRPAPDTRERAYRANNIGVADLEQFNYTDAAAAFRRALEIDGSLAVAHINLSLALFYGQDLPGAAREAS